MNSAWEEGGDKNTGMKKPSLGLRKHGVEDTFLTSLHFLPKVGREMLGVREM